MLGFKSEAQPAGAWQAQPGVTAASEADMQRPPKVSQVLLKLVSLAVAGDQLADVDSHGDAQLVRLDSKA